MDLGFDFPSVSGDFSTQILLGRSERMTTDYLNSNNLNGMEPPDCNCPQPPELDWRPPPDPSLIFGELFDEEFTDETDFLTLNSLRTECEIDFPSIVPVDMIPKQFEPVKEYLAFLISAILAMVLVLVGAAICCVYLRRSGKLRSLFKASPSEKGSRDMSSAETSVLGLSSANHRRAEDFNGRAPPVGTLRETKWSYNSMRPNTVQKLTNQPGLHQASSLGLLMYGDDSVPNLPISVQPDQSRLLLPTSQTLPRQPRDLCPSKSLPSPFQQPPHATAVFIQKQRGRPMDGSAIYADQHNQGSSVYEEIALKSGDPSYGISSSQRPPVCGGYRRPARLPPPSLKPPPPPQEDLSSPVSSHSCSCSIGSSSIDQEIDGIQITPSFHRKIDGVPIHYSRSAYDKSVFDKSTQSNPSSPQDTTVSDCCECSNGRESGYGTEGRSGKSVSKFVSPNLHRKQGKRAGNLNLRSPTKQLWVSVKPSDLSPEKNSNSSSIFRDPDDSTSLAIFNGDKKSHSSHSMTYV